MTRDDMAGLVVCDTPTCRRYRAPHGAKVSTPPRVGTRPGMNTDPTVSPDGKWRWDGTQWVPRVDPVAAAKDRKRSRLALGLSLAVAAVIGVGAILTDGGGSDPKQPESTWQSRWQAAWDSKPAEDRATVCAAWDITPSAAAIQVEEAWDIPPGTGLGKAMLEQVC